MSSLEHVHLTWKRANRGVARPLPVISAHTRQVPHRQHLYRVGMPHSSSALEAVKLSQVMHLEPMAEATAALKCCQAGRRVGICNLLFVLGMPRLQHRACSASEHITSVWSGRLHACVRAGAGVAHLIRHARRHRGKCARSCASTKHSRTVAQRHTPGWPSGVCSSPGSVSNSRRSRSHVHAS